MRELLKARLSPFKNRDFTLFFLAQMLSLVGLWSHDLARAWIIVSATGSSGALGNLNLAVAVPCLFLILQAGVLVDRSDVRRLLIWTKTLLGVCAITLAAVTEFSEIQVWHLLVFGVIEGIIVAVDSPSFQALVVRLVPRSDFQQAIALNSTSFHTSRMLGPIVAAWLMTGHGPSLVFLFDGVSYLLVALVLTQIKLKDRPVAHLAQGHGGLRAGLRYIFQHRRLRFRVFQLLLTLICVYPMMINIFRVFVQKKFDLTAQEFGHVFSLPAFGSMLGALAFMVVKPKAPIRALMFGVPLVVAMLIVVPLTNTLEGTVAAISLTGFGLYLLFASLTVSMHLEVEEAYRGRLGSVIGMGFASIGPLMSFPWGHLADQIGSTGAIWLSATLFALGSLCLFIFDQGEDRMDLKESTG